MIIVAAMTAGIPLGYLTLIPTRSQYINNPVIVILFLPNFRETLHRLKHHIKFLL